MHFSFVWRVVFPTVKRVAFLEAERGCGPPNSESLGEVTFGLGQPTTFDVDRLKSIFGIDVRGPTGKQLRLYHDSRQGEVMSSW